MMSLKNSAKFYALKQKGYNNRTVAEEKAYKRLKLSYEGDKQHLDDLRWRAELAQGIMVAVACDAGVNRDDLENVLRGVIGDNSKPYSVDDLLDLIDAEVANCKEDYDKKLAKAAKDDPDTTNTDDNTDHQNGDVDDEDLPC